MVWYGMLWYGMVWYGMVWYGMVWYGMVWYGIAVCCSVLVAVSAVRAISTVSSALSRSIAGIIGVVAIACSPRAFETTSDMTAERMNVNRKGDSVHRCLMPLRCCRDWLARPDTATLKHGALVSSTTSATVLGGAPTSAEHRGKGACVHPIESFFPGQTDQLQRLRLPAARKILHSPNNNEQWLCGACASPEAKLRGPQPF